MGNVIRADAAYLAGKARQIGERIGNIEAALSSAGELARKTGRSWEGEARKVFLGKYNQAEAGLRAAAGKLKRYPEDLLDIACGYKNAESENTALTAGLAGSGNTEGKS